MLTRVLGVLLALALAANTVQAEIYECVDGAGNKLFTNIKAEAKGCTPLNIAPQSSAPAPKPETKARPKTEPKTAATPANFPRVDTNTQRDRDAERRRILEQELANEQRLLHQARAGLAQQEATRLGTERNYQRVLDRLEPYKKKVKLHEDNIANLRREISNLR